jgi:hypothetical protein
LVIVSTVLYLNFILFHSNPISWIITAFIVLLFLIYNFFNFKRIKYCITIIEIEESFVSITYSKWNRSEETIRFDFENLEIEVDMISTIQLHSALRNGLRLRFINTDSKQSIMVYNNDYWENDRLWSLIKVMMGSVKIKYGDSMFGIYPDEIIASKDLPIK